MSIDRSALPLDRIDEFCRRWKVREFALFGSALREDFRADSDIDVLLTFAADADPCVVHAAATMGADRWLRRNLAD